MQQNLIQEFEINGKRHDVPMLFNLGLKASQSEKYKDWYRKRYNTEPPTKRFNLENILLYLHITGVTVKRL